MNQRSRIWIILAMIGALIVAIGLIVYVASYRPPARSSGPAASAPAKV